MEILGGLIKLDKSGNLPVPWFNRPSLGLATNTNVSIEVVTNKDQSQAPPDIIVTPLKLGLSRATVFLTVDLPEDRGAVFDALRKVSTANFNIALTETVTINQRKHHRLTLVLEPTSELLNESGEPKTGHNAAVKALIKGFKTAHYTHVTSAFALEDMEYFATSPSVVKYGKVYAKGTLDKIQREYARRPQFSEQFDFDRVIVSSNTEARFIRYIYARKGTFEVTVSGRDEPGTLVRICGALRLLNYNILLSRLSRSEGPNPRPGTTIFVAICEPANVPAITNDNEYKRQIEEAVNVALNEVPNRFLLELISVSLGRSMDAVAYPQYTEIGVRIVRPNTDILAYLSDYKRTGKRHVFIGHSEKMTDTEIGNGLFEAVQSGITNAGAEIYDGFQLPTRLKESAEARARVWQADAAVFIAGDKDAFRDGQLIELGIVYGQGKQYVIVCAEGQTNDVKKFMAPNTPLVTYLPQHVTSKSHAGSELKNVTNKISELIYEWFPMLSQ